MGRWVFSALIVGLFAWIAAPLAIPIAMAAVFAVLLFPWLEALERRKLPAPWASLGLTLFVTFVFLVPAVVIVFVGAKSGLSTLREVRDGGGGGGSLIDGVIQAPFVKRIFEKLSAWFPVEVYDLVVATEDLLRSAGTRVAEGLASFVGHLPQLLMGLVVLVFGIYFFLSDGRRLVFFVRRHSVVSEEQTERLIGAFASMCRSVILATVVSGLVQSVLFSLGCLIAGRGNVALIGLLVFLASFVPLIGSTPITFGVVAQTLWSGDARAGVFLLVVAILVGVVDHFVRPLVLRGSANLHPVLAFVAAFGGLQTLGFPGVFLGPIVAGLFVVTVQHLLQDATPPPQ